MTDRLATDVELEELTGYVAPGKQLETLRRHRLKYGVTVLDADAGAALRKLP